MSRVFELSLCMLFAGAIAWTIGCGSSEPEETTSQPVAGDETDHSDHADHAMGGAMADAETTAKITANLASFSDEDRELALKQKVCPISGELLGMMEAPIKLDVKGHAVFICCENCKETLLGDPDKYLAKLGFQGDGSTDDQ